MKEKSASMSVLGWGELILNGILLLIALYLAVTNLPGVFDSSNTGGIMIRAVAIGGIALAANWWMGHPLFWKVSVFLVGLTAGAGLMLNVGW